MSLTLKTNSCPIKTTTHTSAPSAEKTALWIHRHPQTVKVGNAATLMFSTGLLAALPFTTSMLDGLTVISLAITGTLLSLTSAVALCALDLLIPPHHNMKNHVYTPGICEGGRLYYAGNVPILSLESDDPLKAGRAHGYLCGHAIHRLSKRFGLILHTILRQPRAHQFPQTLHAIRKMIPSEYLIEIQGITEGYNKWAKEHCWLRPNPLTADDVLAFHLLPDLLHFQPSGENVSKQEPTKAAVPAFGCSAVVERNQEGKFMFVRNMDWPSFGLAGTYSLVIHRNYNHGLKSTVDVSIPGFAGTLTGMNKQGLCLAMNVCLGETHTISGMPIAFYNRMCLEQCASIEEVKTLMKEKLPLGPYHLTMADPNQAASIHFYQEKGSHLIRTLDANNTLSTLNCRYTPTPQNHLNHGKQRQHLINAFLQNRKRPLEEILKLPFVNNWLTTHRVAMNPQTLEFRVAFDNAFAGSATLCPVPTQKLFSSNYNQSSRCVSAPSSLRSAILGLNSIRVSREKSPP